MYEERKHIIRILIVLTAIVFLLKLFSIQVLNDDYKAAAQNNIIQKSVDYSPRGLIYDRNESLLVYNEPQFELQVIPKKVNIPDTAEFCALLNIDKEQLENKVQSASKTYSYFLPSTFIKQLSNERFARIQDKLNAYNGFIIKERHVRAYNYDGMGNVFGYISEINRRKLSKDTSNYYLLGDYLGVSGLELSYENRLRGKRGVTYKIVNSRGLEKGSFKNGRLDTLAQQGENLTLSIDIELQHYAEKLMQGKIGSIVAIEPSTGEILALVSAPSFNPKHMVGEAFSSNYKEYSSDSLKPLFNRPLMATYPPGSIFKIIQGLIALQEGVIDANTKLFCDGSLIGDHAPPGYYDMHKGIMLSSNNYFYKVFKMLIHNNDEANPNKKAQVGLSNWKNKIEEFGLGKKLGVDLPNEKKGSIPDVKIYDRFYGKDQWKYSNISSLSIGQGELLLTPIQMANLAAIIANRGHYYRPHVVKSIGQSNYLESKYREKINTKIDSIHFPIVIDAMEAALRGTAWRALIKDVAICGKTGTVQNPHGEDHSVFMAFAPKAQPEIALSVYVENAGWGGRAAASIASLLIEKRLNGEITKTWLEDYVIKGNFRDKKK